MTSNLTTTATTFYQGFTNHPEFGDLYEIQKRLESSDPSFFMTTDLVAWLFPTASDLVLKVTVQDLIHFRESYESKRLFLHSLASVLPYYGLKFQINEIKAGENFAEAINSWLFKNKSLYLNKLAIILNSITLFGEKSLAADILNIMKRTQQVFANELSSLAILTLETEIENGLNQFNDLVENNHKNYSDFWRDVNPENKKLILKKIQFSKKQKAQYFIELISEYGLHPVYIEKEIYTLSLYSDLNVYFIYLTKGQFDICSTMRFEFEGNQTLILTFSELIKSLQD